MTNTAPAVILTCWHLIFATIATQVLARTTTLLDGRKNVKMTGRLYLRAIVPIGLLYSASLVCSNMVYLYLSVAFIQMLKAAAPVAVLLTSWAWGVEDPSLKRFINVLLIVAGVALASFGEIDFSIAGFLFQVGGIVFEAVRLVMIQVLLSGDTQKMDPLVSLYYYAPICAVMNVIIAIGSEANKFDPADLAKAGYGLLLLNAAIAFLLNVSSVFLVSSFLALAPPCCFSFPSQTKLKSTNRFTDRQNLRSRHDPHRHPQKHPPRHHLRHDLAHQHHLASMPRLHHRPGRSALLFPWLGPDRAAFPGRLGRHC